jgi:hypothetical protein
VRFSCVKGRFIHSPTRNGQLTVSSRFYTHSLQEDWGDIVTEKRIARESREALQTAGRVKTLAELAESGELYRTDLLQQFSFDFPIRSLTILISLIFFWQELIPRRTSWPTTLRRSGSAGMTTGRTGCRAVRE